MFATLSTEDAIATLITTRPELLNNDATNIAPAMSVHCSGPPWAAAPEYFSCHPAPLLLSSLLPLLPIHSLGARNHRLNSVREFANAIRDSVDPSANAIHFLASLKATAIAKALAIATSLTLETIARSAPPF